MANRALPEGRNPQLEEANSPMCEYTYSACLSRAHTSNIGRIVDENLVERRCLGQTELKVKPGQVGTTNATKPDNLGVLDYAHLRVPLPRDLSNSGIFVKQANRKWPEAYFLMVRGNHSPTSQRGRAKRLTSGL